MRSVFCFEMFQWPPRLFLAWGKSEEKSSLASGPPSSVRSGDFDRTRQICRLMSAARRVGRPFAFRRCFGTKGSFFAQDPILFWKKMIHVINRDRQYPHVMVSHLSDLTGFLAIREIVAAESQLHCDIVGAAGPQLRKRFVFLNNVDTCMFLKRCTFPLSFTLPATRTRPLGSP